MADAPVLAFDAYGTLFDVNGAARECAADIGEAWPKLAETWRAKQLEYTWIHASAGLSVSFREVTARSLEYALAACGIETSSAPKLLQAYRRLPAFPDVGGALSRLKSRGAKLAILSNADADMLDELVRTAGLTALFDRLISTAAASTFKPSPRVYALVTDAFTISPNAITFVSSNRWDVAGAKAFGFRTVWVNRRRAPDEYPDLAADMEVTDLRALSEL
jgi:2-haloacid dehalogenase